MRVLYLVGTLGAGGIERFVTRMCLRAVETGDFEPVVCCLMSKEGLFRSPLEAAGIDVREVSPQWSRKWGDWTHLRRVLADAKPQVVHSLSNFALVQQALAVRSATNASFCVTEMNCYPLSGTARLRRAIQFWVVRSLRTSYVAMSQTVSEHLAHLVHASPERIPVVPFSGTPVIPEDRTTRASLRERYGWRDQDVVVGYVSRMNAHKGQEKFLRVIHSLQEQGRPVKACLVGDGPERQALESLARDLNLVDHVVFTGRVSNVEDYLQAMDILALFSSHEGVPNVILEGMAAGKPIVATPAGSMREMLLDGTIGLVACGESVAELGELLQKLVDDEALRARLSSKALAHFEATYSLDNSYPQILRHYMGLANR